MKKLLNNPIFVVLAAIVAIYLVYDSVAGGSGSKHNPTSEAPTFSDAAPYADELQGTALPNQILASKIFELSQAPLSRNIFQQPVAETEKSPEQTAPPRYKQETRHVFAIWIQEDKKRVSIDNQNLSEGASLGELTVETIQTDGVWLAANGQRSFVAPGESWTYQSSQRLDNSEK